MKFVFFSVFFLFLTSCNRTKNLDWIEIGQGSYGKFFIEKNVSSWPSQDVPYIGVTVLFDLDTPQISSNGEQYLSSTQLILIDCKQHSSSWVTYKDFVGNRATGKLINSGERDLKLAKADLKKIDDDVIRAVADTSCKSMGKT